MQDGKNSNDGGVTWPWVVAFAALAVAHRLVPYVFDMGPTARFAWNFAPVGAIGLFAGARWRSPLAVLVPLTVMVVSDLLLWPFLSAKGLPAFGWMRLVIYPSFMAYAFIGRLIRHKSSPLWISGAALLGAVQFYLITNFACWAGGDGLTYTKNLAGLIQCYVAALPFFGGTVGGDLGFSFLFFGLHALGVYAFQRQKASQPA
jgi:hypothetical protein